MFIFADHVSLIVSDPLFGTQARVDQDSVDATPSPQWTSLEARYEANLEALQQELQQEAATV